MTLFVGRVPTSGWNDATRRELEGAGIGLELEQTNEVGVQVEAVDLDHAYDAVIAALAASGVAIGRDDFAMPLYGTGPSQIVVSDE